MPARAAALILLLAAAAMAWLCVYQVDDAFIVYRYADRLAHGAGFTFNPGERVEGVTCFLWTIALAPFALAGIDLARAAPVLTAACGLATLVLVARRSAEAAGRGRIAAGDVLSMLLLASSPAFVYWSVGALETIPFTLLIVAAARDHARTRSAVWLGLASLTRPETPAVIGALLLERLLARRPGTGRWLAIVGAFFVPFLLFRRAYFGDWLPNTYYAKTGGALASRLTLGLDYVAEGAASLVPTFGAHGIVVTIAGATLLVALLAVAWRDRRFRPEGLVVAALAAACVFEGGDWMTLQRLFVPALPFLALLAAAALRRAPRLVAAAVVAAFLLHGLAVAARERNGPRGLAVNAEGYRHAHLEVARALAERAKPGDLVALMDVGMIGWKLPAQRILDITGLTDRRIAHAPGGFLEKRYPASEVLSRDPRFLVLVPRFTIDERIHADPAFASRYRFVFSVNHRFNWVPPSAYELHVFERIER
jgi:hypothetical protein